jgi:tyrosyl-tRNA synthetase
MKIMSLMQKAGNKPIALFGGGTGMIGDPSGKSDMRKMLTKETIQHNVDCFKVQMAKFIDTSDGKAIFVNNADWLLDLNYIEFLREVGIHFSVNRMLTAECYKSRMEKGLTFLEFNYMLMQSYDFYKLNEMYNCRLEFGGDDEWSNIIGGVELLRRKKQVDAFGMTFKLLTNSEGKKMGKTEKGAVWLDAEKTTPYEFFQYWRNVGDADVIKCMKMLTFIPVPEINEYKKLEGSSAINEAKEKLAYELTLLIHGKEEADKALATAKDVFSSGKTSEDMPTTEIPESDLTNGQIGILDLLTAGKLAVSRSEAKRLIMQGGVAAGDDKVEDFNLAIDAEKLKGQGLVVRKGKKVFHRFIVK